MPGLTLPDKEIKAIWRSFECAEEYQQREFLPGYQEALDLYDGDHWKEEELDPDRPPLTKNLIPNIVRQKARTVTYKYPEFTLKPLNRQSQSRADVARHALKYYWRLSGVQDELVRVEYDREIACYGAILTGWYFRNEDRGEVFDTGRPPVVGEQDATPDYYSVLPPARPPDPLNDRPFAKRIAPEDLFLPVEADTNIQEACWVAYREWVPLDQVKANKRYSGTRELKGTTKPIDDYLSREVRKQREEDRPSDTKYVELIHVFRKEDRLHLVFARERPAKPLLIEKWAWEHGRYPIHLLPSKQRPGQLYCKSTVLECKSGQQKINYGSTLLATHAIQFNRQFQVDQGSLDEYAIATLESGRDGGVVEKAPGSTIGLIPHPQLQPELYEMMQDGQQDLQQLTGLSQYQFQDPPTKRLSAEEYRGIANAGGPLFLADAADFTHLCESVAQDFLDLLQQYSAHTRQVPIYGEDFAVLDFVDVTGEQIRGSYLVEVGVESTTPPNKQSQLNDAGLVLQTVVEAFKLTGGQPLPPQLAAAFRDVLKAMGLPNPEAFLASGPPQPALPGPSPGQALPALPGAGLPPEPGAALPGASVPPAGPEIHAFLPPELLRLFMDS